MLQRTSKNRWIFSAPAEDASKFIVGYTRRVEMLRMQNYWIQVRFSSNNKLSSCASIEKLKAALTCISLGKIREWAWLSSTITKKFSFKLETVKILIILWKFFLKHLGRKNEKKKNFKNVQKKNMVFHHFKTPFHRARIFNYCLFFSFRENSPFLFIFAFSGGVLCVLGGNLSHGWIDARLGLKVLARVCDSEPVSTQILINTHSRSHSVMNNWSETDQKKARELLHTCVSCSTIDKT